MNLNSTIGKGEDAGDVEESRSFMKRMNRTGEITEP